MSDEILSDNDLEKYTLPMTMKKITQRTSKGPIAITKVDARGDFIVLENTCIKKPIVLTNWKLIRRGVDVPLNTFTFEKHFVLHPGRVVKISAKNKGSNNPPHELMSEDITSWGVGTYVFTQLLNHLNQEKATLLEKLEHYEREMKNQPKPAAIDIHSFDHVGGVGGGVSGAEHGYKQLLRDHALLNGGINGGGNNEYDLVDANYEYYFERNIHN